MSLVVAGVVAYASENFGRGYVAVEVAYVVMRFALILDGVDVVCLV